MIKYCFLCFCFLMVLISCKEETESTVLIDVQSVVNKTPAEVIATLGQPDSTYTERIAGKPLFCQLYRKHNIEIQYPDSLSTDIVIYGPHGLPFSQSALKAFKIAYQKKHPSQYERDILMRWYDFDDFEAISFYNVQKDREGQIENFYIYFKAKPLRSL